MDEVSVMRLSETKFRDGTLDVLKGIGIFLMVFDHVGWGNVCHTYIQSFHMPLFFIVSGYLWRERTAKETFQKRFRSLMVPYFSFGGLYFCWKAAGIWGDTAGIVDALRAILLFPTDLEHMSAPALWFLPCMLWTDLLYTFLAGRWRDRRIRGIAVFSIAAMGCVYSCLELPVLPWAMEPVATALFFWFVGDLIKGHESWKCDVLALRPCWFVAAFLFSVAAAFVNPCVDMRSARYCVAPLYLLNGVFGTVVYWNISRMLHKSSRKVLAILCQGAKYLSVHSMAFICMNQPGIFVCRAVIGAWILGEGILYKILTKGMVFVGSMAVCILGNCVLSRSKGRFMLGKR